MAWRRPGTSQFLYVSGIINIINWVCRNCCGIDKHKSHQIAYLGACWLPSFPTYHGWLWTTQDERLKAVWLTLPRLHQPHWTPVLSPLPKKSIPWPTVSHYLWTGYPAKLINTSIFGIVIFRWGMRKSAVLRNNSLFSPLILPRISWVEEREVWPHSVARSIFPYLSTTEASRT